MPLVRFDAVEGRSEAEIKNLLDAAHRAMLSAFRVPENDRYQIYQEHPQSCLVAMRNHTYEKSSDCERNQPRAQPRDEREVLCGTLP
jgi:Tautomerase enzyme